MNLKQCLSLGMKLTKIPRVHQFKQQAWLKPYIELNTKLRAATKTDFEKDFFKLMNNSVFGKTMEDVRKRVNIQLITEPAVFKKHSAKVTYKRSEVFVNDEEKQEYFVGLEAKRTSVKLDKPIYTGFTVFELSKLHMYDFHYNHIMKKYGPEKAKLLFTDTDSLTYHIKTDDLYQDTKQDLHLYDNRNYPQDHPLYSTTNKKVIGKLKDETGSLPISEFVGLRSKMYSIKLDNGKEKKTGKGIKKSVLKKEMRHQDFKDCLFLRQDYEHTMVNFRSQHHQLFTIKQSKRSLSPFDDKRYILEDGCTTTAHGHWRNGVARPTQTPTEPSELIESMTVLSLSTQEPGVALSVNATKPDKQEPITESHAEVQELVEMTQSHINVGEFNTTVAPPSSWWWYTKLGLIDAWLCHFCFSLLWLLFKGFPGFFSWWFWQIHFTFD